MMSRRTMCRLSCRHGIGNSVRESRSVFPSGFVLDQYERPSGFRKRSGGLSRTRHRDGEWFLTLERTLSMAHNRVLRTLGRRHERSDCVAKVVVATGEVTVSPNLQQGFSEQPVLRSIHCHLVVLASGDEDNTGLDIDLLSPWGFLPDLVVQGCSLLVNPRLQFRG